MDSDGKDSRMSKKRKLDDGKHESTMFRLVMDNFKSPKIYRGASERVTTPSRGNIPIIKFRKISSGQHAIVSDLPEGWRRERIKMGKNERIEVITSQGLRITSQAAMDIHTKLHKMPDLRLDWQEMVVLPKGARFDPDDPVVLEMVPVDKEMTEKEGMQILGQAANSEFSQQETKKDLELEEPFPHGNSDQSDDIESTDDDCVVIYNTENILEVITKEESDDDNDCIIVEQTDHEIILEAVKDNPDMILETVKDHPEMILETVKDDVNNCDILETVANARSSHDKESHSSRNSVSSLISSSRTSSDSRLSSVGSVESNFSRDSTRTSSKCSIGINQVAKASLVMNEKAGPGSTKLQEDLPPNWVRRVHQRATGKQDWSIVTGCGRIIRSQKQLDIFTKAEGMQPLKLKGVSLPNNFKLKATPNSKFVPEGDCLSQRLQESKQDECEQDTVEIFEPQIKKASVNFVSDDGIEAAEDSPGNLRKLRRRRGALLMEDCCLVKRKDKLKLIEEPMCWLKPPLTKVNFFLKPLLAK